MEQESSDKPWYPWVPVPDKLHPDKTQILHNNHRITGRHHRRLPNSVHVRNMTINMLPSTSATKYLGWKLNFSDSRRTEVENRLAHAWIFFFTHSSRN